MSRLVRTLLIVIGCAVIAPSSATAGTLSVESGVLRFVDDPGLSSSIVLARQRVGGQLVYVGRSSHLEAVRPGPGCTVFPGTSPSSSTPWSVCPVEGVTAVTVSAGDGDDVVTVGLAITDVGSIPVPVQIDLGTGNNGATVAVERVPVTVVGGAGKDSIGLGSGVTTLSFSGNAGDDRIDYSPERIDPAVRLPDAVKFDGGAGDDTVQITDFPGAATLAGGDGDDSLGVWRANGRLSLTGGAGDDFLEALAVGGPVLLDAGAGNDRLRLNRNDPEMRAVRGGHMIARGGPGDDQFTVGADGDADEIDCGAGADRFAFLRQGERRPPKEDRYSRDCPPFGTRIAKTGTLAGTTLLVTVTATEPLRLKLVAGDARRQLSGISTTRIGRGVNRVRLKLSARAAARLRGKRTVLLVVGLAARAGGDFEEISRGVTFTTR